nr:probable sphingolipid transporter spinster homolog 2 isoform X2 [Tanacetum cinerariifolium]
MNNADMLFRGITIVGTLARGFILDRMNSTIPNAFKSPVNFVCLHTVKQSLRPLSMAMSTVSIHVFGDVPSSPLVG